MRVYSTLAVVALLGCPDGSNDDADADGADDGADDTATSAPGSSGGATTPMPTSTPPTTTTDPPTTGPTGTDTGTDLNDQGTLRFIAMGDGGEGNPGQYNVAAAVEQVCADRGCEFALYLGDNFYNVGVTSNMDQQFQDKFELPYMDIDFPFYITLGNHDYGALGNEWAKSQYQVEYTEFSDKWTLPSEYYTWDAEHVTFISLDSARLFWAMDVEPQRTFVQESLAASPNLWRIAFGHHPYISNGDHGNAGNYEGLAVVPGISGQVIKDFFEEEICGQVTVYFCGHDHTRQWMQPTCGTEFIVSGAAAKLTGMANRDGNPAPFYADDTKEGFAWIEIIDRNMTVAFYDFDGNLDFEQTIEHPG